LLCARARPPPAECARAWALVATVRGQRKEKMSSTSAYTALPSIVAWFVLNIIIGNLNGWILRSGFEYPVLLTTVHMILCWLLSGIALMSCMHPGPAARPANLSAIRKVRTLSLAFCASVACGNIALQYIYVSFAQMVTAAGPLFTIMLMYTMTGKRYSRAAYASMLPMCGGVMMCTAGELNFHWLGFLAVVAATLLRGVKSIIQGRLLTSPEDKFDSLTLLFHMSGCSIAPLGCYVALFESQALFDPRLQSDGALGRWGLVTLSGVVAFFLNLCNFVVTKKTSAVTLQVLGNVKVVFSIAVSLLVFGNAVSSWSVAGGIITLAGVAAYNGAPKA
jgi:drug/metabolite transporter (DMT)-like permease